MACIFDTLFCNFSMQKLMNYNIQLIDMVINYFVLIFFIPDRSFPVFITVLLNSKSYISFSSNFLYIFIQLYKLLFLSCSFLNYSHSLSTQINFMAYFLFYIPSLIIRLAISFNLLSYFSYIRIKLNYFYFFCIEGSAPFIQLFLSSCSLIYSQFFNSMSWNFQSSSFSSLILIFYSCTDRNYSVNWFICSSLYLSRLLMKFILSQFMNIKDYQIQIQYQQMLVLKLCYDCFNFLLVIKKSNTQGTKIRVKSQMFIKLLQLVHSVIILTIFYNIYTDQILSPALAAAQLILTIIGCISERGLNSKHTKFQLLLSLSLGYFMFPNKSRQIGWVFFIKAIKIHLMFKSIRKSSWIFKTDLQPNKYFAFTFDFLRFSLNQYMVMGIFCAIYTFFCDQAHEPIPETHKVIYQLVVTASTIGYGDLTPKSKMQIMFFTYTIPVLCTSFAIYINNLVQIYTNTFLVQQEQVIEQKS